MKAILVAALAGGLAAFAVAGYFSLQPTNPVSYADESGPVHFDASLPVEARIAALERAVSDERLARQLLEDEVFYLTNALDQYEESPLTTEVDGAEAAVAESESQNSRRDDRRRRNSREGRIERLIEAGFLPSQASWIMQREQEIQMDALQARFEAQRSGEPMDWGEYRGMTGETLRTELGEADYERYLEATDRSTSITVSSIIESSPAQTAGLQPGDEIIRYDGERVFSMTDLTRQTMEGEPGQTVLVDVMRNGNLVQVVMPRGPVGITGGRRRF